jgi:Icc-related predicted phosphoesterase
MRVFFVTDIHGSELCYRKFLNSAAFYEADVLLLGGDICGKYVVPYWRDGDGYVVRSDSGSKQVSAEELAAVVQGVRDQGGYPYETDPEALAALESDGDAIDALFERLSVESIERWIALAEERLKGQSVRCLISPGNDDPPAIDEILDDSSLVENPEEEAADLGSGISLVSCGIANPTPWNSPREVPEDELKTILAQRVALAPDPERTIFNFHVPPFETPLDLAPLLDESLKPVVRSGEIVTTHVGSSAVRQTIEEYRPLLGVHGHIHESRGVCKLNGSLCLNPGSEYHQGTLLGGLIQLNPKRGKVKNYQLVRG